MRMIATRHSPAGRFIRHGCYRITVQEGRSPRRTDHGAFQVCADVGILHLLAFRFLGLQSPFLDRRINLAQMVDARIGLRHRARLDEIRNRNAGQQADDRDHNHDLNQRKAVGARWFDLHCGWHLIRP